MLHSAAVQLKKMNKNGASGFKVILIQFFALNSNLKSKFKNLRHVFFKCPFKFFMPDCELTILYFSNFLTDFLLKIDSEQKSIPVNFHINAQFRSYKTRATLSKGPFDKVLRDFVTPKLCIYVKIHMIFNKKSVKKLGKYRIVSSQSGFKNLKGHLRKT